MLRIPKPESGSLYLKKNIVLVIKKKHHIHPFHFLIKQTFLNHEQFIFSKNVVGSGTTKPMAPPGSGSTTLNQQHTG